MPNGEDWNEEEALEAAEERIEEGDRRLEALVLALLAGMLTLAEWEKSVADEIRLIRVQLALLAAGGLAIEWALIEAQLQAQAEFLAGFGAAIGAGELSEAQIQARVKMYAGACWAAYWTVSSWLAKEEGRNEVLWVLGVAEHCEDCVDLAGRGWQPMSQLHQVPGDGQTRCLSNCRCHLEYR